MMSRGPIVGLLLGCLMGGFLWEIDVLAKDLNVLKAGVVKITASPSGGGRNIGTGFIVRVESEEVYIITAAHVILGDNQPEIEFFNERNMSIKGSVLPGAEVNDDLRGLALVVVRGQDLLSDGIQALPFGLSTDLVSGGEEALVIGHPGGGGDWALVKRDISNRVGRDITLDPGLASRFSGGPIFVDNKVVGIVMSNRGEFGLGITHKSVLNYIEGFGVMPSSFAIVNDAGSSTSLTPAQPSIQTPSEDVASTSTESVAPPTQSTPSREQRSQPLPSSGIGRDGMPMVLVPEGTFWLGSDPDEICEWDSLTKVDFCFPDPDADYAPRHQVKINAFSLDAYETTVDQFGQFVAETGYTSTAESKGKQVAVIEVANFLFGKSWQPHNVEGANWRNPMGTSPSTSNPSTKHPVVQISWFDAHRYCQWAGKRLPTEAEWEYAARAGTTTKHWWGDDAPIQKMGNLPDRSFKALFDEKVDFENFDDGFARSSPIGSFLPNDWGLYDMAGNVWEWTNDWYDSKSYVGNVQSNPTGPDNGEQKVKRGGSWFSYKELKVRRSQHPEDSDDRTGFRCAKDAS